jgi:hypothetical protein
LFGLVIERSPQWRVNGSFIMGLIPDNKPGKLAFFTAKVTPWTDNAVAIGTTTTAVSDMTAKLATASDKLDAQIAAQEIAKAATAAADAAIEVLVIAGANIIKSIRTKAATAGDGVYELAQIPAPALPTPVTTLGTPSDFSVELGADGSLTIKWKCVSPRATGMVYQVYRRATATGEFEYIGGSGAKKFVDTTLPAGSSQVTYQIQAVRSTAIGPSAQFNVNFGAGSSGTMTANVEQPPVKKAA